MKLSVSRNKNGIVGYTIFINKAEAEASGFIDPDGTPIELEKEIDLKGKRIIVKKSANGIARKAIKSGFIYEHFGELKSGEQVATSRNEHYTLRGSTLYKQNHQEYLRGEPPVAYAELVGGVFYGV
jgi:hypothetical protein